MDVFWADKIAEQIIKRKKYKYIDKDIDTQTYNVKTSASLSGVLHIGRLADTIRSESVVKALRRKGYDAKLIWVAEDMDAFRKVPKGVPESFKQYLGIPVSSIPDPWGCHDSYAEHHLDEYLKVVKKFVQVDAVYRMSEEYKSGNFNTYIKKILRNLDTVREIVNACKKEEDANWHPWKPVCKNCGKIITTRITESNDRLHYVCEDYTFNVRNLTINGCGYSGTCDPLVDPGKLLWKSEWAAQWARWQIVSEGAGKEYQVPCSAFWVNAEIVEKVLDFPAPVPIFYEYLTVGKTGGKMSASEGNVIYPKEWLDVAEPSILKLLYNKKVMKTRAFDMSQIPRLYDELDRIRDIYFGRKELNKTEKQHYKRLFETITEPKDIRVIPYSIAVMVSQLYSPDNALDKAISLLESMGHIKNPTEEEKDYIKLRLKLARNWVEKYGSPMRLNENPEPLPDQIKPMAEEFIRAVESSSTEKELYQKMFDIASNNKEFFKWMYKTLIGKEYGPKLSTLVFALGKQKVIETIKKAL
ncbi:lysine--tRNA ligase [Nanoarchaeota archaeon]|nr:MAG: lysine--tRNA ligase [Nanoarchaeota archaeon]